jgi:hypothetical protein
VQSVKPNENRRENSHVPENLRQAAQREPFLAILGHQHPSIMSRGNAKCLDGDAWMQAALAFGGGKAAAVLEGTPLTCIVLRRSALSRDNRLWRRQSVWWTGESHRLGRLGDALRHHLAHGSSVRWRPLHFSRPVYGNQKA